VLPKTSPSTRKNKTWVSTDSGNLLGLGSDPSVNSFLLPAFDEVTKTDGSEPLGLFDIDQIPFVLTAGKVYQWQHGNAFKSTHLPLLASPDWQWLIPLHFPEEGDIWLLRRHRTLGGYEIGKLEVLNDGKVNWTARAIGNQDWVGPYAKFSPTPTVTARSRSSSPVRTASTSSIWSACHPSCHPGFRESA
jgi:hypothetical protein